MSKPEWIETKKECDVTGTGELVTRRITFERADKRLERKDVMDISLRFIGLAAIFLPLWLFFKQQRSERDKQKALFQLEVYSNTATELHTYLNQPLSTPDFEKSKNRLLYELYPKLVLLNEKEVVDTFNVIKQVVEFSSIMSDGFKISDSLFREYASFVRKLDTSGTLEGRHVLTTHFYEASSYVESQLNNCLQRLDKYTAANTLSDLALFKTKPVGLFKELKNDADSAKLFCTDENLEDLKNKEFNEFLFERLTIRLDDIRTLTEALKTEYKNYHMEMLSKYAVKLDSTMIKSSVYFYSQ